MSFSLDEVVPWGRSFDEYVRMFLLNDHDLRKSMLGCGDGPACFNSEATKRGSRVISIDPLYAFGKSEIEQRVQETYATVVHQADQNRSQFIWSDFESPEHLGRCRLQSMNRFLDDYDLGKGAGRYVQMALPTLPFSNSEFELALCSHFLFLYEDHFDQDFHIRSITEMCRVASEVRLFPLVGLSGHRSRFVQPVLDLVAQLGFVAKIEKVTYEFQRGANQMLRIST